MRVIASSSETWSNVLLLPAFFPAFPCYVLVKDPGVVKHGNSGLRHLIYLFQWLLLMDTKFVSTGVKFVMVGAKPTICRSFEMCSPKFSRENVTELLG